MINDLLKNLAIAFNEPGAQNFVARDDSLQRALDNLVAKIANQFPLNSQVVSVEICIRLFKEIEACLRRCRRELQVRRLRHECRFHITPSLSTDPCGHSRGFREIRQI